MFSLFVSAKFNYREKWDGIGIKRFKIRKKVEEGAITKLSERVLDSLMYNCIYMESYHWTELEVLSEHNTFLANAL